jgi:phenylalanyl-tRNA synthetase beta chain
LFGLDDQILELAITANRPDGLSMQGIAREVAALSGGPPSLPASDAAPRPRTPEGGSECREPRHRSGGSVQRYRPERRERGPLPAWLQRRLERAGVRPINNVVDITNLVMLETGQPLHAFDREALAAARRGPPIPGRLGLRQARGGERLTALDGEERTPRRGGAGGDLRPTSRLPWPG